MSTTTPPPSVASSSATNPAVTTTTTSSGDESDDGPSGSTKAIVAMVLAIVIAVCVALNVIIIGVFVKVRRIRKERPFYLVVSLAVTDLVAAVGWGILALVTAAQWQWSLGDSLCKLHGFLGYLCLALTMHTSLVIAVEKMMRFWFPVRHYEAFGQRTVPFVLVLGLWVFDIVVACLPLLGWGEYVYVEQEFQCVPDHPISLPHLDFIIVVVFAIPMGVGLILYGLAFYKVKTLGKDKTADGQTILHEDTTAPKESYAQRLHKQQVKFRYAPMKKDKPKLKDQGTKKKKVPTATLR